MMDFMGINGRSERKALPVKTSEGSTPKIPKSLVEQET